MSARPGHEQGSDGRRSGVVRTMWPLVPVLVLPVLLVAPALRAGYVLSSADTLLDSYLFAEARPPGFTASNPLLGDATFQFIPWRRLVSAELRAGRLPFWNPHASAGAPLLGNSQSGVFDPLSFPYLLVREPSRATVWVALLRLWVAGLGAFLLARRLGASPPAAMIVGIVYGTGGFTVVWLLYPHVSSSAWFPWIVLAAESLATGSGTRAAAGLAVSLAAAALGGHPEVAFLAALAASLYVVVRRLQREGWRWRPVTASIAALLGVGALTFALAAVQVVPLLEAIGQGGLAEARQAFWESYPVWIVPRLERAVLQVFPYLFGRPSVGDVDLSGPFTNFCEQSGAYASLLGLGLAVVGLAAGPRRSAPRALGVVGLLAWLHAIHFAPLLALVKHLPVLQITPQERGMFVPLLAVAVLAAFGVDALAGVPTRSVKRATGANVAGLAFVAVIAAVNLVWLLAGAPRFREVLQFLGRSRLLALWFTGRHEQLLGGFGTLAPVLARHYVAPFLVLAVGALVVLLLARRLNRGLPVIAGAVIAVDLLHFGAGHNPAIPTERVYPTTTRLEQLRDTAGDGRIVVLDWGLPANVATHYGLDDILGYDAIGRARVERLLRHAGPFPPGPMHWPVALFDRFESPVLDVLSVRAVASVRPLPVSYLRLVHCDNGFYLYENPRALPRAFVPQRVITVPDLAAAERDGGEAARDPGAVAVVETTTALPSGGAGWVTWRRPAPGRIELDVAMERAGIVVVSEAFDPGWRAWLDGSPGPVYPADLALMAVAVPGGEHRVVLTYRPRSWPLAVLLSALGLIVLVVLLVRRRAQNTT